MGFLYKTCNMILYKQDAKLSKLY